MLAGAMAKVTVRRLNREGTGWDPDFKVPSGKLQYGLQEIVLALVRWGANEQVATSTGGGWVRQGSFAVPVDKDPGFNVGDLVEQVDGMGINPPVYITGFRPMARIAGRYRFTRYEFASRQQGV